MILTGIFINAFTMSFSLYSWIPLMAMAASITRPFWKLRVHIPYLIIINHLAAKSPFPLFRQCMTPYWMGSMPMVLSL